MARTPRSAGGAVAAGDSRSRSPADQSGSAVDGPARVPRQRFARCGSAPVRLAEQAGRGCHFGRSAVVAEARIWLLLLVPSERLAGTDRDARFRVRIDLDRGIDHHWAVGERRGQPGPQRGQGQGSTLHPSVVASRAHRAARRDGPFERHGRRDPNTARPRRENVISPVRPMCARRPRAPHVLPPRPRSRPRSKPTQATRRVRWPTRLLPESSSAA